MAVRVRVPLAALFLSLMKHTLITLATLLLLTACGVDSGHFKLSGRFLNMNQGEFYIYSPEGGIDGIDTIRVVGGRFTYERPCEREAIMMLVFPNFTEQPIFAEPGKSVDIKADASHMKDMAVTGTKANEQMTGFRKQTSQLAPPDVIKKAVEFIKDHPDSPVGIYLLKKFFVQANNPNYKKAVSLANLMLKEQPKNGQLIILQKELTKLANSSAGATVGKFSGPGIDGTTVSDADIGDGVAVISTWSAWSYQSQEVQRHLRKKMRSSGGRLRLVSICVDADRAACKRIIERDTLSWPNIFDGMIFDSKAMQQVGLTDVPDNLVLNNRKIVARGLSMNELDSQLDNLLRTTSK